METLSNIQHELNAPKSKTNNFGKYKYRSCEDICNALKPLLVKYKATMYFDDLWDGNRLTTTLHYIHADTHVEVHASAVCDNHKGMSTEQSCGSCMSYTHKYALGNLLLIDDATDPDSLPPASYDSEVKEIAAIGDLDTLTRWKEEHLAIVGVNEIRGALITKYNQLNQK